MSVRNEREPSLPLILVIDDDDVLRAGICAVLKHCGYRTIEADNGGNALRITHDTRPDVVLLDVDMPVMNGIEVCHQLRSESLHKSIPIIMLTALGDGEIIDQAFSAGATDFLTKPINWTLLSQRVATALRTSRLIDELQGKQQQLIEAQRIAQMGYWTLDIEKNQVQMSEGASEILGMTRTRRKYAMEELLQRVHPDDIEVVMSALGKAIDSGVPYKIEHRVVRDGGKESVIIQQGEASYSEEYPQGKIIGTIQDITELHNTQAALEYKTNYDELTELPNRRSFEAQAAHLLEKNPEDVLFAVVFLGLDHFSQINDVYNHAAGDQVLKQVAERLRNLDGYGHFVSRFGGDVFALLLKDIHHIDECDALLSECLKLVAQPFIITGQQSFITASIGASVFPLESESSGDLIKGAEAAMLTAKEAGGDRYVYRTAEMNLKAQRRKHMEQAMRRAIINDEFLVYYQPQVSADDGSIIGMEALIRWSEPNEGLISPVDFIPLAEETGLIMEIGAQILRKACADTQRWRQMGFELRVGVNLSAQQFKSTDLVSLIANSLHESGLPAESLEVEVTESMAMEDCDAAIEKLQEIRNMGVKTSMDDFGTGYSSLSYLQRLPLDTLKVDQSFVRSISEGDADKAHDDCKNGAIASAVIAMARSLGLHVIAEGVETDVQRRFLREQGSHILQGYLFGKPMSATLFESYLIDQNAHQRRLEENRATE